MSSSHAGFVVGGPYHGRRFSHYATQALVTQFKGGDFVQFEYHYSELAQEWTIHKTHLIERKGWTLDQLLANAHGYCVEPPSDAGRITPEQARARSLEGWRKRAAKGK